MIATLAMNELRTTAISYTVSIIEKHKVTASENETMCFVSKINPKSRGRYWMHELQTIC